MKCTSRSVLLSLILGAFWLNTGCMIRKVSNASNSPSQSTPTVSVHAQIATQKATGNQTPIEEAKDCSQYDPCVNGQARNSRTCECSPMPKCPKQCTMNGGDPANSCWLTVVWTGTQYINTLSSQTVNGEPCAWMRKESK